MLPHIRNYCFTTMAHVDSPLSSDASDGREGGEVATGTIIAAMECRGGAVIASDTEVSVGKAERQELKTYLTSHSISDEASREPFSQARTCTIGRRKR